MAECGTYAGLQRHNRRREQPCEACRQAGIEYKRRYRRANPDYALPKRPRVRDDESWEDGLDEKVLAVVFRRIEYTGFCWYWLGSVTRDGYGRVTWNRRQRQAHRFVYEVLVGPPPEGLEADHLCRTRSCVNPDHLEFVPHDVNTRRGFHNGKRLSDRPTHCPQGHEYTPENTYVKPNGWWHCKKCNALAVRAYAERKRKKISA